MENYLEKLAGGDRRSIGRVDEVVAEVLADTSIFRELFTGLIQQDEVIRMRTADAVEKISRQRPDLIEPYKEEIIYYISKIGQQEVRWHWAQIVPRLELNEDERLHVVGILITSLDDRSKIVNALAMQALADLIKDDAALRPAVLPHLVEKTLSGSPAVKIRGRKILRELREIDQEKKRRA